MNRVTLPHENNNSSCPQHRNHHNFNISIFNAETLCGWWIVTQSFSSTPSGHSWLARGCEVATWECNPSVTAPRRAGGLSCPPRCCGHTCTAPAWRTSRGCILLPELQGLLDIKISWKMLHCKYRVNTESCATFKNNQICIFFNAMSSYLIKKLFGPKKILNGLTRSNIIAGLALQPPGSYYRKFA